MESSDRDQKPSAPAKKPMPGWLITRIILCVLAVVAVSVYVFWWSKKGGNNGFGSTGTPMPAGNMGVSAMPSPTNVSSGVSTVGNSSVARVGNAIK